MGPRARLVPRATAARWCPTLPRRGPCMSRRRRWTLSRRRGGTASSRLRSLNRVWGALLFSRFQKRSGTLNFVPGRLPQRLNGLQQAHPCRGTRLGNAPDRGSRILACISRSVSIIPMVGLQVSLIWSSGGTETFGLLTSSQGRPVPHSLRHLEHQLRFYAWLWHATHDGETVSGMEGWYLESSERVAYAPPSSDT